jgi:hydroxypyruvate isomerase
VHTHHQRFDVNCSILFTGLFTELPLLKRAAAARSAGFDAVEFWWPFAEPVPPETGWIGCEDKPSDPADSATSFGWR